MLNSTPYYKKTGKGKNILLLFHGFGQDHQAFTSLTETVSDTYTCYSFDLYFHGRSTWAHDEQPLQKQAWKAIINTFLQKENIETFSLLGFSLGSKLALVTLEAFPERTKEIFLLAPDGIKTNFWYTLATGSFILRKLFKSMILHPERFLAITSTLQKLNLVDKSLLRFAGHQMNTPEKRKRVYYAWVVFRRLKFNPQTIATLINTHHIATTILAGKHDKVIKPEAFKNFIPRLKKVRFEILNTSHHGLIAEAPPYIVTN